MVCPLIHCLDKASSTRAVIKLDTRCIKLLFFLLLLLLLLVLVLLFPPRMMSAQINKACAIFNG
jgi:hypothetical protein